MIGDPTAVLRRDLSRTARQPLTYVVRVLFVAALLGVMFVEIRGVAVDGVALADQAIRARALFSSAGMIALMAVVVVAPALMSTAFFEEREQGTLDLLRLTRLSPWAVVLGGLASRAVGVGGLLLASLPILAMLLPFGGIGVGELLGFGARAVLTGAVLGTLGGYLSLSSRSVVAPMVAALGFTVFGMFTVPVLVAELGLRERDWAEHLSPLGMGKDPDAWRVTLGLWAPAVFLGLTMTVARYRHLLLGRGQGDDPEQRRWERWGTGVSALILLSMGLMVAVPCVGLVIDRLNLPFDGWDKKAIWCCLPLWFTAMYLWYLQLTGELVDRFGDAVRWPRLGGLKLPRGLVLPWEHAAFFIGNPVVVRELTTRAFGGLGLVATACFGLWGGFGLHISLHYGLDLRDIQVTSLGAGGLVLLVAFSLAAITQSVTDERRAGTLPLLLTTTFSPRRVVVGKLAALGVRFGGVAIAIGLFGALRFHGHPGPGSSLYRLAEAVAATSATVTWVASLAAVALGVALVVRPAYLAWGVNLLLPLGWLVVASAANQAESDLGRAVAFPFAVAEGGKAIPLFAAAAFHVGLTFAAIGVATLLLRRVAAREVGP